MRKFNVRLAPYIDEDFLGKLAIEVRKPQSMRAVARKLKISVYAVNRLMQYYKSMNGARYE